MQFKYFIQVLIGLSIYFLTGCGSRIDNLEDDPKCSTTLEGNYYSNPDFLIKYPFIVLKDGKYQKLVKGDIQEVDSNGIIFKQETIKFSTYDSVFYPMDTLYGAVNDKGKIIFGSVPKKFIQSFKMFIYLEKEDNPKLDRLILEMNENEPFAFCIDPGKYKIKEILWEGPQGHRFQSVDIPEITFTVDSNKANYIGSIYKNFKDPDDPQAVVIPYKSSNSNDAFGYGYMFGIVGGLAYLAAYGLSDADGIQVLHIEDKDNFVPLSELEVKSIPIYVKELPAE